MTWTRKKRPSMTEIHTCFCKPIIARGKHYERASVRSHLNWPLLLPISESRARRFLFERFVHFFVWYWLVFNPILHTRCQEALHFWQMGVRRSHWRCPDDNVNWDHVSVKLSFVGNHFSQQICHQWRSLWSWFCRSENCVVCEFIVHDNYSMYSTVLWPHFGMHSQFAH